MSETSDEDAYGAMIGEFTRALDGALTGPLARVEATKGDAILAMLAVVSEFAKTMRLDFTALACSAIAACEQDQTKALGMLISAYASKRNQKL